MLVLLPISRFRVTYEVASGRPYSQLERLVLRGVHEGARTLDALRGIFQVHPRLLVETLVTLTQAGWVAVSAGENASFVLTAEGQEAVVSEKPPSSHVVSPRFTYVVVERVTGAIISNDDVRFVTRKDLESLWDQCLRLRADVVENSLDEGQVQHLLPRRPGEWIRWIGPIDMVSKGAHWLPVNVDVDTGNVVNLPDAWAPRLRAIILDEAKRSVGSFEKSARTLSWDASPGRRGRGSALTDLDALRVPPTKRSVRLSVDDLLFGREDHARYIDRVFASARTSVLVASAFLNLQSLNAMKDRVLGCLSRGVSVDLLWGYGASQGAEAEECVTWLQKLAYEAKRDGTKGMVRVNRRASGSHAKVVLWDSEHGFEGCVGSHNWLSAERAVEARATTSNMAIENVSVRFTQPGLVAALVRCASAFWSGSPSEALTSTADRWRRLASDLDMQDATESARAGTEANAEVRLILDREHEILLRGWLGSAQGRLLITSHKLGAVAEPRLLAACNRPRMDRLAYDVVYGQSELEPDTMKRVLAAVGAASGKLARLPGLHAKLAICDQSACITSYNFLSADPFGTATRARELGVVIESAQACGWLLDRVRKDLPQ